LQATVIKHELATADSARVQGVLDSIGEQPAGRWLRTLWLKELARREDWPAFRAAWRDSDDTALRCNQLRARLAAGAADADWISEAQKLWLDPASLPTACDEPMAKLAELGKLDEGLRWQRIDLAIPAAKPAWCASSARAWAPMPPAAPTPTPRTSRRRR
jgi:soluble lytic murein transglycosylase